MSNFVKILGGIGILIAVYILVYKADLSTKVIQTIGNNSIAGIKALQGR